MGTRTSVVTELVADGRPRSPTVVRSLDELSEPRRGLRCVQPVRIGRRTLQVVDLPAPEVRTADVPTLARAVRGHNERPFPGTDQHAPPGHVFILSHPVSPMHGCPSGAVPGPSRSAPITGIVTPAHARTHRRSEHRSRTRRTVPLQRAKA